MAEEQLTAPVEVAQPATEPTPAPVPEVPAEPPAPPTIEELVKRLDETKQQYEARIERMEQKFTRRIGSVVAKKNALQEEVLAIRGNTLQQQTFREPKLADYNGNAEQFISARDDYQRQTAAHEQAKQQFEQQRVSLEVGAAVETLREAMEDTLTAEEKELVNKSTAPTSPEMFKFMASVPEGPKLAAHLAKFPGDAEYIAKLQPADQAGALLHLTNAIRTGFSAPQPKPAAAAPLAPVVAIPPPPPVARGASASPTATSAQQYVEQLRREREAKIAKMTAKK